MNGSGVTATGLNLTAGEPAYEIAVDPSVIALGSFERVTPNPFGTSHAFYAGDTGGAIIGHHIDIYDWQGRAAQNAWGVRHVGVTPAPTPGTGNLLGEITPPAPSQQAATPPSSRVRGPVGRAAPAHPRAAGEDPRERTCRRAERCAAGREARDRRRQPAHLKALHLRRRARHAAQPSSTPATTARAPPATSCTPPARSGSTRRTHVSSRATASRVLGRGSPSTRTPGTSFIAVAGIVMNTAWYAPVNPTVPDSGPRWQPSSTIPAQYAGDQYGGFVQRHPAGL